MNIKEKLEKYLGKSISESGNKEIYFSLVKLCNELSAERKTPETKKKLYYISAEFLIGKLLSNNLINLGIYDSVKELLCENKKSLSEIEECEIEPSLGNGGLGRLAACFMDSIATLGLNGDGMGLLYHSGLFRQSFKNNMQIENPDYWMEDEGWLIDTGKEYEIDFGRKKAISKMYDILVPGYEKNLSRLHLFDIKSIDENIITQGISFDKTNIEKNLTLFLYPDDSDEDGRMLRIYQEYFMVSSSAQLIVEEAQLRGCKLYDLNEYAAVQINDTHPAMIIPELIRILCEKGIDFEKACETVQKTCAYTNHTVMAEALEKWNGIALQRTLPKMMEIIEKLDEKVRKKYSNEDLYILDDHKRVHMANMAIHYGYSINGVAKLHTNILKTSALNSFYRAYPHKFNNKTNGITFRRWLLKANPSLSGFITELIGDEFKKDANLLKGIEAYKDDASVLEKFTEIKLDNKRVLKEYLARQHNISVDENSVFDIQIKRLHEYKRQQLNALYLIDKFLEIKEGKLPSSSITSIFGAKAAPSYVAAKDIIHLILTLSKVVENDEEARKFLKIVFIPNYNVTSAEKLIPACDISEQISLASKEASGTGNMKMMLNGAVTLGTLDGANVEIESLVGKDNIYIFGASSGEIATKIDSYNPRSVWENNSRLSRVLDFITCPEMINAGNKERLERLKINLSESDYFMALYDFDDYKKTKNKMIEDYKDKTAWARKMLINTANSGYFSSDRTIEEYNNDIWKLGKI